MSDLSTSSQNDPTPTDVNSLRPALPDHFSQPPDLSSVAPHPEVAGFDPPSGTPAEPEQGNRRWIPVLVGVLGLALIGGGVAMFSGWFDGDSDATSATTTVAETTTVSVADTVVPTTAATSQAANAKSETVTVEDAGLQLSTGHEEIDVHSPTIDVARVVDTIAPSVVTVITDVNGELGEGTSVGTGVFITADGNILTNAHVVEGATQVRVLMAGTTEPVSAEILATDPQNDLALIDIDGSEFVPAVFADPEETKVGDPVVAMGFALDLDGGPSVTLGIVSAANRTLEMDEETALDGLIQTDAAISSGNSGGPLVNAAGEVVGINTAVARGDAFTAASNVGFAISVDEILQVVPELRNQANGEIRENGYLGVILERRTDGGQGALVGKVQDGTPAAEAGVKSGDVVLDVDGSPVNGAAGLKAAIRDREPGDEVHITVLRNGEEVVLTATLTKFENN